MSDIMEGGWFIEKWREVIYDEITQVTALKKMMEIINTPRWQHGFTSAFSIA
ncbi:MAG: hypothetical protein PHV82_12225 [Victivallaceae bacterium]|nr:hypothetical protein [Victivallaceae bacterium]